MSGRVKSERSEYAVNFSGLLGARLQWHAWERMRHLFLFQFAVEAACDRVKTLTGTSYRHDQVIREKATHQIDTGFRSTNTEYDRFDETDQKIVQLASTTFSNTDAAHFCNLGFGDGWDAIKLQRSRDAGLDALIGLAETLAGNTVQLPQRVNIGLDRIIDQFHWAFSNALFGIRPAVSLDSIKAYAEGATNVLGEYKAKCLSSGKDGLAASCSYYMNSYQKDPVEGLYKLLCEQIAAECKAWKLEAKDYLG
jgi:hypothetical protein